MKVQQEEPLDIYSVVSEHAVDSALIKNEGSIQLPVYYTSGRMDGASEKRTKGQSTRETGHY